ncbi:(S)-2-haloacid dehalogenase 4A [Termitomyces sp. T112]|nr:(S)-2-haloacid dehalogenase 4A [Termitomyces sp. T112]
MPSYSLANWAGGQSVQRSWPQQTDSRYFDPVPVSGQRGDEASRTELDASTEDSDERLHSQNKLVLRHDDEESQMSPILLKTSGSHRRNVQSDLQPTNTSINLEQGSTLQSNGPGVGYLQHTTSGFRIIESINNTDNEGVKALLHQHMAQRESNISRLATETRTSHMAQTLESSKLLSRNHSMLNTRRSGADVGGKTLCSRSHDSEMDIGASADDISRIFDDDVTVISGRTEGLTGMTEEYVRTTIEPHLLRTRTAGSPASVDIPTDIFHTPSRSPTDSRDSLIRSPSPSPFLGPVRRRLIMSHVAVPPFPRGSGPSDYRPIPRPEEPRPIRRNTQTHVRPGEALQAVMSNNGALHTGSSQNWVRAESRAEPVASFRPPTGVVQEKPKPKEKDKGFEAVSYRTDVGEERAPSVAASVSTFISARCPSPPLPLGQREFGYASYNSELDFVHLTICGIPYELQDVIFANTRFLREVEPVPVTSESQWECYSTKADVDDYAYTRKWSSSCESLQDMEGALCTGEFWVDVDGSDAEEWEEEVAPQWEDEDDDEIMFIGRSEPSQYYPQPPPNEFVSKPVKSSDILNVTIRAGTPVDDDDDDEVEIIEASSSKQPPKPKPKARSSSPLGQVGVPSGTYRPHAKLGGGRATLSPESTHSMTRPRILARQSAPIQLQQITRKRPRADDDKDLHSAKASRQRRATGPSHRDVAGVQHNQHLTSPSLSNSHSGSTKKSKVSQTLILHPKSQTSPKPPHLLAMANMITNTMKSHPPLPPPQIFSDPFVIPLPLFSANENTSMLKPTNSTTGTSSTCDPPTPTSDQPEFTADSTTIVNSSSDFLAPRTSYSPFLSHAIARGDDSPFLAGDSLYSPTENFGFPSPEKQLRTNAKDSGSLEWSSGNGTINPALLGGQPPDKQKVRALSPFSPVVSSAYLALIAYDSDTVPPSPSPSTQPVLLTPPRPVSPHRSSPSPTTDSPSSPLSHLTSSPSQQSLINSHLSKSDITKSKYVNDSSLAAANISDTTTRLVRVSKQSRVPDGMIATTDLYLDGDSDREWSLASERPRKKVKAKRVVRPRICPPDHSGSEFEEEPSSNWKSIVVPRRPITTVAKSQSKSPSALENWPSESQKGYCHQCRRKTSYRQYTCTCGKKYCIRCLSTRYDGKLTYTFPCPTFKCPLCHGICTCDKCTRGRGELYIPRRKSKANIVPVKAAAPHVAERKLAPDLVASPATRPRPGGKTDLPTPTISGPVQYWATIYGMDGERIGNAFVGNGNEDLVLPHFLEGVSSQRSQNRIYVGDIQESWGFGDRYLVKDLDPVPWYERNNGPNERIYVGAKAPLSWSSRKNPKNSFCLYEEPPSFDNGTSFSLSSLIENEDVNETGASR